ncbi:MAG: PD40 domain-containing protein [Gemmatimonadaceae bacterium]|nr:PD40 domain-containing protein [Gemmatimonadaceae bacterium]
MRRNLVVAITTTLALASSAGAQGYFGKNQVQYNRFDWRVLETEHFRVHYYKEEKAAVEDAARMAERSYARLSRILGHQFRERKPIVIFASRTDFAQNNIFGDLGEGTGGVTDAQRQRNVLPLTGDFRTFEHVLTHEMVHQFQYDVFSRGRAGANLQALQAVNPPLWMMEGMAEYLSLGTDHKFTDMWLRDAAMNGDIPTIEQMTMYPDQWFPYRFGESLMRYIGERWGDQVIGQILEALPNVGVERAFKRELGLSLEELGDDWKDALQKQFLPTVVNLDRPRRFAENLLNPKKSGGNIFLAPTLSDDGSKVVFLSNGNYLRGEVFIDLWLADARTGKRIRRLVKSTTNPNAEELRLLYSQSAFSPDGSQVAYVGQRNGKDVLYLTRTRGGDTRRIDLPVDGVLSPVFTPDGSHIVFSSNKGGITDLAIVAVDGTGFRMLTNDRYGDFMPNVSPDGRTIAFASDRGAETDFDLLRFSRWKISLYDMATGNVTVLPNQPGLNINPQWAPDSRSIAYITDRNGVPNVFLYDFGNREHYQLTNVAGGVSGITEFSPALTWARTADRLAFVHFEKKGDYTVWTVDNPRALKNEPYRPATAAPAVIASAGSVSGNGITITAVPSAPTTPGMTPGVAGQPGTIPGTIPGTTPGTAIGRPGAQLPGIGLTPGTPGAAPIPKPAGSTPTIVAGQRLAATGSRSVYRGAEGYRTSDSLPPRGERDSTAFTVDDMLDSADLALPDPTRFRDAKYKVSYEADYVARPSIGYAQDNFGRGLFGGTTVVLSDLLGNNRLAFTAQVNGRLQDAIVYAGYTNLGGKLQYNAAISQFPYFFFNGQSVVQVSPGIYEETQSLARYVLRDAGFTSLLPKNRFKRFELGLGLQNIGRSILDVARQFNSFGESTQFQIVGDQNLGSLTFLQPKAAFVSDNTLNGYTAPLMGRRMRFAYEPTFGSRQWHEFLADYRRYDPILFNFVTIATRLTSTVRTGKDETFFPNYIGNPNGLMWLRGYDRVNALNFGCQPTIGASSGCSNTELLGSRAAVASAELRIPLVRRFELGVLPVQLPPVDGAIFYDAGIAFSAGQKASISRPANYDANTQRFLLRSYGYSIRVNLFNFALLRWDYAIPLDRPERKGFWQWSLGSSY